MSYAPGKYEVYMACAYVVINEDGTETCVGKNKKINVTENKKESEKDGKKNRQNK